MEADKLFLDNGHVVAHIEIKGAANMSDDDRRKIGDWLRAEADFVEHTGPKLADVFTSRYWHG